MKQNIGFVCHPDGQVSIIQDGQWYGVVYIDNEEKGDPGHAIIMRFADGTKIQLGWVKSEYAQIVRDWLSSRAAGAPVN